MIFKYCFNDCLVSLTIETQEPPIHKLNEGLNFFVISVLVKEFSILVWFRSFNMEISLSEPIKLMPLSVQIVFGFPFLAMNLIKARKKLPVLKLQAKSKCIGYVAKQARAVTWCLNQACTNLVRLECLTTKGPKKSIPM